jgi:hypothetical protein
MCIALIHGYRYHFIHTHDYPDWNRSIYWSKVPAIGDMLHSGCQFVVTIDSDAIFKHLEIPLEWLLNRWNITPSTSFAMALDNYWEQNEDSYGLLNINAGFIVAQDLRRTHEILRQWHSCPDNEAMYPNCTKYSKDWPAEQGAWGDYMRRKYNDSMSYKELNCTEANGYEGMGTECHGIFVSHFTVGKDEVKSRVAQSLATSMFARLQKEMVLSSGDIVVDRPVNEFTLP